jgi:hypothetical protein
VCAKRGRIEKGPESLPRRGLSARDDLNLSGQPGDPRRGLFCTLSYPSPSASRSLDRGEIVRTLLPRFVSHTGYLLKVGQVEYDW